ncbi:putative glycosyl transferase family 8 family [Aspergillus brunneoviolaceus CBS 621.78]|uniref:Nucleotide-diphospho-sugar transferase n=1 Tax=Aspergillus brunneoviolaceus CBS 621.78 TaxID=1450534 RepID=A0ACD1GNC7_9EURO|nr:nucleotide-diphospho-sugar transferase [Aspergillus brunneoviolaceus CBS 621.78]RAH50680.1 nucleotide-diphospho-sugar transferase [Aspergillus brunneoviolaceus CBS 621.78]
MKHLVSIPIRLVGIALLSPWWSSGILPWQRANDRAASPTQRTIYAAYLNPPTEFQNFCKRDCLRRDGAQVIDLPELKADWTRFKDARWAHVLTRLRLWQMVQYDRILLLDADSVLIRSNDAVWDLPELQPKTALSTSVHVGERVLPLPESYVLAGLSQLRLNHTARPARVPEDFYDWETLNVGFLMLQPSLEVFDYFAAMLAVPESFESSIADQRPVNVVFAADGPMPWTRLDLSWNVQWPWPDDLWAGYAVLHDKWWAPLHSETLDSFHSWYWRMIGFYSVRDG